MKLLLCLLLGAIAFGGTFGVLAASKPTVAGAAGDEDNLPAAWRFAPGLSAELREVARDTCALEPGGSAHDAYGLLELRYRNLAAEYNNQVAALVLSGQQRPSSVAGVAPPLEEMRSSVCKAPTPTPTPIHTPTPVPTPTPIVDLEQRFITLAALDYAAVLAGWPMDPGWWPEMRSIIQCETRSLDRMAHNTTDPNGGSYGLAQLNGRQHFDKAGESFDLRFDAVVNLRTALWLRTVRGHYGGEGGWGRCAAWLNIN